jgi:hypothetical protein
MDLSREIPPALTQISRPAHQWVIYPHNLASLFPEEDLEHYDTSLSSNAGYLFSSHTFRLGFWTVRDQANETINGAATQTNNPRTVVQDEIIEAQDFDRKLQARLP